MRVLCVAEKPSIAKSITQILSGGRFDTLPTAVNYIKNYKFDYPQTNSQFTVTCVTGHLTECDFDEAHRKWNSCDPFSLFDAPVYTNTASDKKAIERNLVENARAADTLMIWTDCDREGEHIGSEVVNVCRKAKRNIVVRRARFSAIIAQQIHRAAQNPVELDLAQAAAVEARILLDLRIGAAFTRMQTLILQGRFAQIAEGRNIISYGPCQFPTLGFVVHKWNLAQSFVPEPFWYIHLALTNSTGEETPFNWKRGHIFDADIAIALYDGVMSNPIARVTGVTKKATKKWKPLPLTTVELQKAGSRLLKLTPKRVLDIAEKLYQQGFLSYPRTETDQFDNAFDFQTLIQKQTVDPNWGQFATSLREGGFLVPRKGKKDDKAHPPIHPTAHAANLVGEEKKVYEFITRRFLACCSKDAEGFETTVEVDCGGEAFNAKGLIVLEKNYLVVYPYDKWVGHELPDFEEGQEFQPSTCELKEGQTTRPSLLTEADLVTLMDKNGIGTDATIAQHIQTIIDRDYVIEKMEGSTKYLIPSKLGIGLVEGYNKLGLDRSLTKPQLRRETERNMVQVCQGTKSKAEMLEAAISQYKEMFIIAKREFEQVVTSVREYLDGTNNNEGNGGVGGGGGGPGGNPPGDGGNRGGNGGRGRGRAPRARGRGGGSTGGRNASRADHSDSDLDGDEPPPPAAQPLNQSRRANSSASARQRDNVPGKTNPPPPRINRSQTAPTTTSNEPSCQCPAPAAQRTVTKETASKGRKFWTCASNTCGWFQWADEQPSGRPVIPAKRSYSARQDNTPSDGRVCKCSTPAILREVQKDGPNKGRKFWKCGKPPGSQCEDFFEWDDEPPRSTPNGGAGPSSQSGQCYNCNQTGHWSNACPNASKRSKSFGSSSTPATSAGKCFKCNEEGHYSNACPQDRNYASNNARPSSSNVGPGKGGDPCYKCGEIGHWSNACPGPSGQKSTTKSRGTGTGKRARPRGSTSKTGGSGRGRGGSKKKSAFGAPDGY